MTRRSMYTTAVSQPHPPALTVCLWPVEQGRRGCEAGHVSHQGTSPSPLYRPDPAGQGDPATQGGCHFLAFKELGSGSKMGH